MPVLSASLELLKATPKYTAMKCIQRLLCERQWAESIHTKAMDGLVARKKANCLAGVFKNYSSRLK